MPDFGGYLRPCNWLDLPVPLQFQVGITAVVVSPLQWGPGTTVKLLRGYPVHQAAELTV